jgi:hypothetical protein
MVSDAEQAEVAERACTFQMANALNSVTLTSADSTASAIGGHFVIISNLTSICWKDMIWMISLIGTVVSEKGPGTSAAGPLLMECVIRYGHENILIHLSPKVELEVNFRSTHHICHSMISLKYSEYTRSDCIVYIARVGIVWDLFGSRSDPGLNSDSGSIFDHDLPLIPGIPLENVACLHMGRGRPDNLRNSVF